MLHQRRGFNEPSPRKSKIPTTNHQNDQGEDHHPQQSKQQNHYYYEEEDEDEGKKRTEMFEKSCGLAQFFVNPWLFLWLRCHKVKVILCTLSSHCCNYKNCCRRYKQGRGSLLHLYHNRTTATFWDNIICRGGNNGNRYKHQQQRRRWGRCQIWMLCIILAVTYWIIQLFISPSPSPPTTISKKDTNINTNKPKTYIPIVIQLYNNKKNTKRSRNRRQQYLPNFDIPSVPDYGGLDLSFPTKREISKMEYNYNISLWDGYQDTNIYKHYEFTSTTKCHNVNWRYLYHPNCNFFHELNFLDDDNNASDSSSKAQYINSGFYRDVFSFEQVIQEPSNFNKEGQTTTAATTHDTMALKTLKLIHNITRENILEIATEALVMERLVSSPRIMNIYGHCSTTVATEFVENEIENVIVPYGGLEVVDIDKGANKGDDESEVVKDRDNDENKGETIERDNGQNPLLLNPSQNNLTSSEKLNLAYDMARSIADLHGFKDGVIVHDDIQLRQWLRSSIDGRLLLGDFNRARIMRWNDVDQKYCKFRTGAAFGDVSFVLNVIVWDMNAFHHKHTFW